MKTCRKCQAEFADEINRPMGYCPQCWREYDRNHRRLNRFTNRNPWASPEDVARELARFAGRQLPQTPSES